MLEKEPVSSLIKTDPRSSNELYILSAMGKKVHCALSHKALLYLNLIDCHDTIAHINLLLNLLSYDLTSPPPPLLSTQYFLSTKKSKLELIGTFPL